MLKLKKSIPDISRSNLPVILTGEPGTGKELFARAIHSQSDRKDDEFVKINAVTLPFKLLERELFGYSEGAFTKKKHNGDGIFDIARKGFLFIEEIGALPQSLQARLLQVTNDSESPVLRTGQWDGADIRIIVSTSENPHSLLKKGKLRRDLYYRLNVINVKIPVLRRRIQDILVLTDYFIDKYCLQYSRSTFNLSEKIRKMLLNYSWPGNIEQLEHLIALAVMKGTEKTIIDQLEEELCNSSEGLPGRYAEPGIIPDPEFIQAYLHKTDDLSLKSIRRRFIDRSEKEIILSMLEITGWNRKEAAVRLGISYKSLLNKMKAYTL
jgi:transcriptional regulator with PAS, ATPase and Fis domain